MSTSPKDMVQILRAEAQEQARNSKYFTASVFNDAASEIERLRHKLAQCAEVMRPNLPDDHDRIFEGK